MMRISATAIVSALGLITVMAAAQTVMTPAQFVMASSQSDQYEILAGHIALEEAHNPHVRAFADMMLRDHGTTSRALMMATDRSHLQVPPGMGEDQHKLLYALQGARGQAFDLEYLRQQVLEHTQALTLERMYAASGTDANLRQAAQAVVPIIEAHLATAERLQADAEKS